MERDHQGLMLPCAPLEAEAKEKVLKGAQLPLSLLKTNSNSAFTFLPGLGKQGFLTAAPPQLGVSSPSCFSLTELTRGTPHEGTVADRSMVPDNVSLPHVSEVK